MEKYQEIIINIIIVLKFIDNNYNRFQIATHLQSPCREREDETYLVNSGNLSRILLIILSNVPVRSCPLLFLHTQDGENFIENLEFLKLNEKFRNKNNQHQIALVDMSSFNQICTSPIYIHNNLIRISDLKSMP